MSDRHPESMVREFHEAFEIPVLASPTLPDEGRRALRRRILEEEYQEYLAAERDHDLVEVADALADMVYVIFGTALEYGIPLGDVIEEVHRSNMSKLGADGRPVHREDGKVIKGPGFFRPEIAKVLERATQTAPCETENGKHSS